MECEANMINFRKNENGFTGVDIAMAVLIITVFMTVIGSMYINLYVSNAKILREEKAIGYATAILEKVDEKYYDEVNDNNFAVVNQADGKKSVCDVVMEKGYNPQVQIVVYQPNGDNEQDFVKTIPVTIQYTVGKKTEQVNLQTIKTKEKFTIPNKPEIADNKVPVKYDASHQLVQTSEKDSDWYQYTNKKWAMAVLKSDISDNGKVKTGAIVYVWVPRFAYFGKTVEFIYGNQTKTVNKNGNLEEMASGYQIPNDFSENSYGFWVEKSKITSQTTANLLNNSQYGQFQK